MTKYSYIGVSGNDSYSNHHSLQSLAFTGRLRSKPWEHSEATVFCWPCWPLPVHLHSASQSWTWSCLCLYVRVLLTQNALTSGPFGVHEVQGLELSCPYLYKVSFPESSRNWFFYLCAPGWLETCLHSCTYQNRQAPFSSRVPWRKEKDPIWPYQWHLEHNLVHSGCSMTNTSTNSLCCWKHSKRWGMT